VFTELVLLVGDTVHAHNNVASSCIIMIDMFIPDHLYKLVIIMLQQAGCMRVPENLSVVRNVLLIENSAVSGYWSPFAMAYKFSLSADKNMHNILSTLLLASYFLDNWCGIYILVDPVAVSRQVVLPEGISGIVAALVVHQCPNVLVVHIIGLVECIT